MDSKRNPYSGIEQKTAVLAIWGSAFKYRFGADTGNRGHYYLFEKPRDSLRFVLRFARAAAITSCVKTYETYEMELWWLLLLADIFRWQNVEVSKCDQFCPGNFIVWSLDMSREFP